ncbi:MAG: 50S ribosomal protein L18 [Sphingobacteriales bacterium]|nr:MAG: 50S ribosomal protein L18 [Sphingobacteriales bacterium]
MLSKTKVTRRLKLKYRIRKKINGSTEQPRLCVYKSNTNIYAQLVDDTKGITMLSASSAKLDKKGKTKTELSKEVGKLIADLAKQNNISTVVFDRNGFLYHGRVKALADAARENGLQF